METPPRAKTPDENYRALFPEEPGGGATSKAARAHAIALDLRKFEIELYWKRATYFWVFTGAALVGYLAALTGKDIVNREDALLLTSSTGFVFSLAWYYVNRASKFWQLNWEFHVDMLEDGECGPLYKTVLQTEPSFFDLAGAYPFSVSKLNQWLSLFVSLTFAALAINTGIRYYVISTNWQLFPTACVLLTAGAIVALTLLGRVSSFEASPSAKHRRTTVV